MLTLHGIEDKQKLETIKSSLETDGWIGVPLVVVGDNFELLTGTHRYYAAKELGWEDREIPTIQLSEVFEEAGLDYEEVVAEWDYPTFPSSDFEQMLLRELPHDISEKYGIQLC